MRGSAAFRTGVAPGGALAGPWVQDSLWTAARAVPSLDLRFADNKSLVDATTLAQLVTFTRASSGTFVGSDGLLKNAPANILLQSGPVDTNNGWTKAPETTRIGTETLLGQTATIYQGSGSGAQIYVLQSVPIVSGTVYTLSVYARLVSGTKPTSGSLIVVEINPTNPAIRAELRYADISLSSDVARYSLTFTAQGSGNVPVFFVVDQNNTAQISIFNAQLEVSPAASDYIPTTSTSNSIPRFDHNPTTGESLGLLVEEARTNLKNGSENFSNAYWAESAATRVNNNGVAPNGTTTACLVTGSGAGYGGVVRSNFIRFLSSTTYTFSCFAKAGTHNFVGLRITTNCTNVDTYCKYNLSTGEATSIITLSGTVLSTYTIPYPNGWYRCVLVYTTSSGQNPNVGDLSDVALVNSNGSHNYLGTGNVLIWGAQVEIGASPSSYIPTVSAAVTRAADVATIAQSNLSSFYNQVAGTVYGEGSTFNTGASSCLVSIDDTTVNNRIQLRRSTTASTLRMVSSGGSVDVNLTTGTALGLNKIAAGIAASDQRFASNGVLANSFTSITPMPTITQVQIGNGQGSTAFNGTIKRIAYWPTRLSNEVLQRITQP